MSSKKKSRPSSARSPKSKGSDPAAEGIYSNPYFMNSVVALVGSAVKVHTVSGCVYEGILKTFSPQFDVVVELAHKVDPHNSMHICLESVVGKMVFKQQGIVKIAVLDQDLDYATHDTFQTDTAISKFNGQLGEKELEPWDSTTAAGDNDFELDAGGAANGWNVNDMFRQNEEVFGVTSSFDHDLSGYTTPLQKETKDYKETEAKASKIANEIENSSYYKNRIELENGDEEEKYASVARPSNDTNPTNSTGENPPDKYVPPPKRRNSQVNKVVRTSSSSPPNSAPNQQQPPTPKAAVVSAAGLSHPQTPKQAHQHSSSTSYSASSGNSNIRDRGEPRERMNGGSNPMYESPKPQRVNSNARHGRNYGSSEGSRSASNGSMSSPTSTISSASSSNHSEPSHHRNPSGSSSYGNPHVPTMANSVNEHKAQHNQPSYTVVQNNPPIGMSATPPIQQEQHHRNPTPYSHGGGNPNPNQNNDYRSNQVYVHNNAVSPSTEQQYIQASGSNPHYGGGPPMPSSSGPGNDHRGPPIQYGHHTYSVPMISTAPTAVVEMRNQPPPHQNEISDGPQMMGPQPPVVQTSHHYRKPPIVTAHAVVEHVPQSTGGPGSLSHKTTRRRKETNELKAFGQDYKLSEPDEVALVPTKRSPHGVVDEDQQQMGGRMHDGSEMHPQSMLRPQTKQDPQKIAKSKLNPNAKEFVYNPTAKPFTPPMSTPSQSRPHTPQTPAAGYAPLPPQPPLGHPVSMVVPYVVTTQPPYHQPPTQQTRYPKVHMGVASPPSQMVAAATGQPLLAPGPLSQFTVPYPPQGYIPQPYQHMIRMMQDGMPPVFAALNIPEGAPQGAPMPFMAPAPGGMAPPPPPPQSQHPQHPPMHHQPPHNNASSPQSNGNNPMTIHLRVARTWHS